MTARLPTHFMIIYALLLFVDGAAPLAHSDVDEPDLIGRAIDGDTEAFGELYMRHLNAVYRYIYFRVNDVQDAEDLTEQVFLKVWEALPGYKQMGKPLRSWIYRIAHNSVMDFYRRKQQSEKITAEALAWENESVNVLDEIIEVEEAHLLARAINELPDEQQELVILRFIEGLNHEQVADILQKSNGACRTIQYRALAKLNRLLSDQRIAAL
ncbi:MAG TPA: sigma-70 family RNA polymerase sigma factor [Anaerolineae bacterium]|nr:sigma-70 family RNA polymerase sigma factor [Anaerolineae bacterium]